MILHASIQLFSAAQARIFHGVSHGSSHPLGSTGVDFIRNVGEPFEGVRSHPFLALYARVYTRQRVLRVPASEISASRCGRTHHRTTFLSLSFSIASSIALCSSIPDKSINPLQRRLPTSRSVCAHRRQANISRKPVSLVYLYIFAACFIAYYFPDRVYRPAMRSKFIYSFHPF